MKPTTGNEVRAHAGAVEITATIVNANDAHNAVASVVGLYGAMVARLSEQVRALLQERADHQVSFARLQREHDLLKQEVGRDRQAGERVSSQE